MDYKKLVETLPRVELEGLCEILLLKRENDGLNGRKWDSSEHLKYEDSIADYLDHKEKSNENGDSCGK